MASVPNTNQDVPVDTQSAQIIPITPLGSENGSENSGSITRGGLNPSAAAMLILYEVMAMYATITGINANQQKAEISAQQSQGTADGKAIKSSGEAMKKALVWAGSLALIGAAVGFAFTAVGTLSERSAANQVRPLEEQAAPMNRVAQLDDAMDYQRGQAGAQPDQNTLQRAHDLENGRYGGNDNDDVTRAALQELYNDPGRYARFKTRLDESRNTSERGIQNKAMGGQNAFQRWNVIGQSTQGATNSGGQMAQGLGQQEQAKQNAISALQKSALAMTQSSTGSLQQAQSKSADAQNAVVHVLRAIRQASSNV